MFLVAFIVIAVWIAVSISAGILFGRMATLNEQNDLAQRRSTAGRPRAIPIPILRIARNRAA